MSDKCTCTNCKQAAANSFVLVECLERIAELTAELAELRKQSSDQTIALGRAEGHAEASAKDTQPPDSKWLTQERIDAGKLWLWSQRAIDEAMYARCYIERLENDERREELERENAELREQMRARSSEITFLLAERKHCKECGRGLDNGSVCGECLSEREA